MSSVWGVILEERKGIRSVTRFLRFVTNEYDDSGEAERGRYTRAYSVVAESFDKSCVVCVLEMYERFIWRTGLLWSAVPCIVGNNGWSGGTAMPLAGPLGNVR